MSTIRELVENPHLIYKNNFHYFNFLLNSYEGGKDYCNGEIRGSRTSANGFVDWALKIFAGSREVNTMQFGNLFIHPKERNQDYLERMRMSYYYNFCAPIIDIYTDHLFKQAIIEDFGSIEKDVQARRENIDNKGGSIGEFRKEMADLAQIYGHVFVVTDSPKYEGVVQTKADILDNGLLPYFTLHHPQNILNWALDEFGSPYWVLVKEFADSNINPFSFNKERIENIQYRLWTKAEWYLYDSDYKKIAQGKHNLGAVPITCVFDKQSKKVRNFLGISAIADIVFIARDIYNSCSELKQILRDQTFAFLAIQGNSDEYSELSIGTSKGLLYPENRNVPQYVSPPSLNAEVYFSHIDRQIDKMFQLAKLETGSIQPPNQKAIIQSGVSKAWDFNQTNSALSKKAGNLEDGETKLWQMFAKWQDVEFDGSVEYPHEFSIQDLNTDLDEAQKMFQLALGTEFDKAVKEAIMKKKFPRMNDEQMNTMIADMQAKADTAGQGSSSQLLNRIPSLNRMAMMNANSGGKTGGVNGKGQQ